MSWIEIITTNLSDRICVVRHNSSKTIFLGYSKDISLNEVADLDLLSMGKVLVDTETEVEQQVPRVALSQFFLDRHFKVLQKCDDRCHARVMLNLSEEERSNFVFANIEFL